MDFICASFDNYYLLKLNFISKKKSVILLRTKEKMLVSSYCKAMNCFLWRGN